MKIQVHYIKALGLIEIGNGIYKYDFSRDDLRITFIQNEVMFKIVARYKYTSLGEPVEQISYINLPSLENFGQLALDGELPTSFKLLVIDRIVGVLFQKSIDRIKSN